MLLDTKLEVESGRSVIGKGLSELVFIRTVLKCVGVSKKGKFDGESSIIICGKFLCCHHFRTVIKVF